LAQGDHRPEAVPFLEENVHARRSSGNSLLKTSELESQLLITVTGERLLPAPLLLSSFDCSSVILRCSADAFSAGADAEPISRTARTNASAMKAMANRLGKRCEDFTI
jgi:hypothetical protein